MQADLINYYYFYIKLFKRDVRKAYKNLKKRKKSLGLLFLGIVGDAVGDFLLRGVRAFPA